MLSAAPSRRLRGRGSWSQSCSGWGASSLLHRVLLFFLPQLPSAQPTCLPAGPSTLQVESPAAKGGLHLDPNYELQPPSQPCSVSLPSLPPPPSHSPHRLQLPVQQIERRRARAKTGAMKPGPARSEAVIIASNAGGFAVPEHGRRQLQALARPADVELQALARPEDVMAAVLFSLAQVPKTNGGSETRRGRLWLQRGTRE